ncbi:MAG: YdeI/OmpD-associated family protein, partial [Schleiferiaceae bacterium]
PNHYFIDGCGRCSFHGTDQCKVRTWADPLVLLREIMLQSGLEEEAKWGQPTYTLKGKNVAMIFSFKDSCGISFFKGVLLQDDAKILVPAGANSNVARLLKITSAAQVAELEPHIHACIAEAIELEKSGAKIPKPTEREPMPETLAHWLENDPQLQTAWDLLTPGRQRSYILHVGSAKQEQTQLNRIEKCIPKIYTGKGFNEY